MEKVIAKFNCHMVAAGATPEKTWVRNDAEGVPVYESITRVQVAMNAVYKSGDKPENDVFAASTPSGSLTLSMMNEAIRNADFFKPNTEYLITIEEVKKPTED